MAADFLVKIGADVEEYLKGLGVADKQAKATSSNIIKSLAAASKASEAMGGSVAKGSNQAALALTNLGRVAQDAPYGFIGIANNLNPLLESFQRLKQETGSGKAAFQALGSSLMGAGGLGLALSAVTAIVSIAQIGFSRWWPEVKKSNEAAKDFVDTLSALKQAQLDGEKNAATETTRLQLLYKATQDANLSLQDRNKAYDELINKYPKFFTEAEREKTLLGQNVTAYNNLTTAILAAANARAAEERISKNTNRQLENRYKIQEELAKQEQLNKEIAFQESKPSAGPSATNFSGDITGLNKLQDLYSQLKESQKAVNDLQTDSNILRKQNIDLSNFALQNEIKAGFTEGKELDDKIKKQKELNAEKQKFQRGEPLSLNRPQATPPNIQPQQPIENGLAKATELAVWAQMELKNKADAATEALRHQQEVTSSLVGVFGSGLTNAFQQALSGTQSFVSAMGQFIGQLITRLIAATLAAAALAAVLGIIGFGPGLGGAASSFGSFKNLFSSFSGVKLAEGGIVTKPTIAMVGEGREKEAVLPLSKLQGMMNNSGGFKDGQIVGVLQGSDLVLQYQRATIQKGRIG